MPVLFRGSRLKLLLILLLPLVLIGAANLVYYTGIGMPGTTTNRGVLVVPPQVMGDCGAFSEADWLSRRHCEERYPGNLEAYARSLHKEGELGRPGDDFGTALGRQGIALEQLRSPPAVAGGPLPARDWRQRWQLLVVGWQAGCPEPCRQSLYLSRQVHIALGREAGRLHRVYVDLHEEPAVARELVASFPGLEWHTAGLADWERRTAALEPKARLPGSVFVVDPQGFMLMYYTPSHDGHDMLSDLKFLLRNQVRR